jgi:thioredoxin reductase (NADPH)
VDRENGKIAGKLYDVTVVGGGVAGLAAAMTAGRLGLQVLILEETVFGGSVAVLEKLDGYPGVAVSGGWEFTQTMVKQAEAAGCLLRDSTKVTRVRPRAKSLFTILCSGKEQFRSRSVIICTGGSPRALGLQGEERFVRRGIHTCAQCAGGRYKGQDVAVAGNGSFAARAARHLLELGCRVLFISGATQISADVQLVEELENHKRFDFIGRSHVTALQGGDFLQTVKVTDLASGGTRKLAVAALFVYRTIVPNSELVDGCRDAGGFLTLDRESMTSLSGVFGAGRVVRPDLPIEVMVGDGSRAALAAAAWLRKRVKRLSVATEISDSRETL